MGKNNRPKTTETRSISFDAELLKRIDAECDRLRVGRSEFIEDLALMYFQDPVRLERARMLSATLTVVPALTAGQEAEPAAPVVLARSVPVRKK